VQTPRIGAPPPPRRWTFTFRYWKQIKNFGLDRLRDNWFVSLLERMHELGTQNIDDVMAYLEEGNKEAADALRFHKIDHDHEHVTMKREEFDWVDKTYLDYEDTYPICQVHVSKAFGRIIGFFDETKTFNVLLLDPNHNLWLTKFAEYKKRECLPLDSQYANLRSTIDKAIRHLNEEDHERAMQTLVRAIADRTAPDGITRVVVMLNDGYENKLVEVLAKKRAKSLQELFEHGLMFLELGGDGENKS